MAKMGRPQKEINKDQFEELCKMQCTLDEIAGFFKCSPDTIQRFCEREYGDTFANTHSKYAQEGKISLRRAQLKTALNGNVTMQIWLGRQLLGQTDKQLLSIDTEEENKQLAKELVDMWKGKDNES